MTVTLRSVGRWKRDSEATRCEECAVAFGLLTRRHHCRSCGGIFCALCSDRTIVITLIDPSLPQRVCGACFKKSTPMSPPRRPEPPAPIIAQQPPTQPSTQPPQPEEETSHGHGMCNQATTERSEYTSRHAGDTTCQRESESSPESGDLDSDDEFDRPLDMASRLASALVSSHCIPSTQNLSFLSVLQDSLKRADANNVLSVLIFASAERQQAMVVTVEANETMADLAARLTEMYFKLENPPFRKMSVDAAAALREKLRFTNEFQVIDPSTEAAAVASHCRNVILSACPPEIVAQMCQANAASGRSVREFWRSERSDTHRDDAMADGKW